MNDFINKFTVYDLIGNTIPGFMTTLAFCFIIPGKVLSFLTVFDNNVFLLILVFGFISYCVGWIISDTTKIVYNFFKFKNNIPIYKFIAGILIICIFEIFVYRKFDVNIYTLLILDVVYSCFYLIAFWHFHNKQEDDKAYNYLIRKCYSKLEVIYDDINILLSDNLNEKNIKKVVEYFGDHANFMIQTDSKYNRVHNYSSSKSFSKNLSGSCLINSFIFSYFFMFETSFNYQCIFFIMIIVTLLSFFILHKRYLMFEKKTNMIILSYYLDFLSNKFGVNDNNKSDLNTTNITINN